MPELANQGSTEEQAFDPTPGSTHLLNQPNTTKIVKNRFRIFPTTRPLAGVGWAIVHLTPRNSQPINPPVKIHPPSHLPRQGVLGGGLVGFRKGQEIRKSVWVDFVPESAPKTPSGSMICTLGHWHLSATGPGGRHTLLSPSASPAGQCHGGGGEDPDRVQGGAGGRGRAGGGQAPLADSPLPSAPDFVGWAGGIAKIPPPH